jgi:uncharacterized membrane protein (DUF485 family)
MAPADQQTLTAKGKGPDYAAIAKSPTFRALLRKKYSFILPVTVFFFAFFFALPILTSYTDVLKVKAIGDITWAWVFAFAQFIMTWTLCIIYTRKANEFDKIVDELKNEVSKGGSR